jgi:hypothetical protein
MAVNLVALIDALCPTTDVRCAMCLALRATCIGQPCRLAKPAVCLQPLP